MTTARPGPPPALWLVLAAIGWGGLAWLAAVLFLADPPAAGFDLELILRAGREVAAGRSPYDPALLAGQAPDATSLFYAYPPPVGQAAALIGWLPLPVALGIFAGAAAAGLGVVTAALARRPAPGWRVAEAVLPTLAVAPFFVPFALAVVFGNLDALFPLVYGSALLAALGSTRARTGAGVALGLASVAKLYPAGLGLWFLVRGIRERRRGWMGSSLRVVVVATATVVAVLVLSLLAAGADPWRDYATVVRTVAGAEVVDARNVGPAAIVARLVGGGEGLARTLHLGVIVVAVAVIAWSAWARQDEVESLAIASVATLVLLPVTWYHYPAALIPFGVAAVLRDRRRRAAALVAAAVVVAMVALVVPPLLWVAVGLLLVAVRISRGRRSGD